MPVHSEGRPTTDRPDTTTNIDTTIVRLPAAWVTAYSPAGKRRRWAGVMRCPHHGCRGGHVYYGADLEALRGTRRAGCGGGKVWCVVALVVHAVEVVSDAA